MKEIQIRNINQKEINKIVEILFLFCYGENRPDAYKNGLKQNVNEFIFNGFNKDTLNKLNKVFKEELGLKNEKSI